MKVEPSGAGNANHDGKTEDINPGRLQQFVRHPHSLLSDSAFVALVVLTLFLLHIELSPDPKNKY
jgi:hypothetical protein